MDNLGFSEIAGIGDNNPPPEMLAADALKTKLGLTHGALIDRRDELLAAEERLPMITDDEAAGKVGDYVKEITKAAKAAEGLRVAAKEPYLASERAVDGFFLKGIVEPLLKLQVRVEGKQRAYLVAKAERERKAREDAARLAREEELRKQREAEAAALAAKTEADLTKAISKEREAQQASVVRAEAFVSANAKPAEMARTRGDMGSVSTLKQSWQFEIVDPAVVPRAYLMVNDAAIKAHMKARMKDKPPEPIPGVRFYDVQSVMVR